MAFSPFPAKKFDPSLAAHLLWRAGFGGTWADAEKLAARGLEGAVEWLLAPAREKSDLKDKAAHKAAPLVPPEGIALFKETEEDRKNFQQLPVMERKRLARDRRLEQRKEIEALKRWWLQKMLTTERPLEEKLTLFWHSHFASSFDGKIHCAYPMWRQNELFRRFAFGRFHDQLRELVHDPAMLVWLDNAQSRRQRPNENLARELMELFSLGVGHYTEDDVKESARALTGYGVDRETWEFVFREKAHDPGQKTFLGNTGDWSGDDITQIICEQPAASRFMARKFLDFFLWPEPDAPLVEEAARVYREGDMELAAFLRKLFTSQEFYSRHAIAATLKSPVVLTVGALKSMRLPFPEGRAVLGALQLMGQDLFFPPDVNGWPGGLTWINSNVLLVRYNFSNYLINGVGQENFRPYKAKGGSKPTARRRFLARKRKIMWSPSQELTALGLREKMDTPEAVVDFYVRDFLNRPVSAEFRQQLIKFLKTDDSDGPKDSKDSKESKESDGTNGQDSLRVGDEMFDERVRGVVHLIMSSPDYQLC